MCGDESAQSLACRQPRVAVQVVPSGHSKAAGGGVPQLHTADDVLQTPKVQVIVASASAGLTEKPELHTRLAVVAWAAGSKDSCQMPLPMKGRDSPHGGGGGSLPGGGAGAAVQSASARQPRAAVHVVP